MGKTKKYFGIYRGLVVDNADPMRLKRLRIEVPSILAGEPLNWASPCVPVGKSSVPRIGAAVWVMFEEGDLSHPVWMGTLVTR
jgi:hypothetical protein